MIEKFNDIKTSLLILSLLIIVILVLIKGCGQGSSDFYGNEVIGSDTTIVEKSDTVFSSDTIIKHDIKYITNIKLDTVYEHLNGSPYTFIYNRQDSLLKYSIFVNSSIQPDSVGLKYDINSFLIHDTTIITDSIIKTITNKVRVNQVYFGGEAVVYPGFNAVFGTVDFVSKKGFQIEAGVGVMDNNPAVKIGFKKLISFRKKK